MKKAIVLVTFILILLISLAGCENREEETKKTSGLAKSEQEETVILIAAASSLKNVMEELQNKYIEKNPNVKLKFTYGSSGSLEQQIREGAPVDIFISAASKQMDSLEKDNLLLKDTRFNLLENKLVLIVPKGSLKGILKFSDIGKADLIAIGDPESVPVGQYAKEALENLKLYDEIEDKLTKGKDVLEVLSWVSTGNVDAGFVYATDVVTNDNVTVVAEAPDGSVSKIVYPAAVLENTKNLEAAKSFTEFLKSEEASTLMEKYGFVLVN